MKCVQERILTFGTTNTVLLHGFKVGPVCKCIFWWHLNHGHVYFILIFSPTKAKQIHRPSFAVTPRSLNIVAVKNKSFKIKLKLKSRNFKLSMIKFSMIPSFLEICLLIIAPYTLYVFKMTGKQDRALWYIGISWYFNLRRISERYTIF